MGAACDTQRSGLRGAGARELQSSKPYVHSRAEIVFIAPGEVHLAFPFAAQFCQQNGFMHAGAIASVADSANGYAAYSLAPPDTDVLAVEFKINLLAPAKAAAFLACGRVLRPGRTLTICQADVFTTGAERALIATMLSTIIVRPGSSGDLTGDK